MVEIVARDKVREIFKMAGNTITGLSQNISRFISYCMDTFWPRPSRNLIGQDEKYSLVPQN